MVMFIGLYNFTNRLYDIVHVIKHYFVILTFGAFESRKDNKSNVLQYNEGNGLQKDKIVILF